MPDGLDGLNVSDAIYDAVNSHAEKPGSPGYIKAYGLKEWWSNNKLNSIYLSKKIKIKVTI